MDHLDIAALQGEDSDKCRHLCVSVLMAPSPPWKTSHLSVKHTQARLTVPRAPEPFEVILLQVDKRMLLVSAQRVNRGWNKYVSSSPATRRTPFYLPLQNSDDFSYDYGASRSGQ
ncbi:hypothetical protein Micbo1qcDRAFT_178067 [Microdochium bolleyi]|uniref:Uncharacterized protein n=1 Tax=Microdochium bolleyi TaxID=196109 RepID=A0A136IU16_9PEZI|nr:hypothetical protein Micbo1qcDRAFT_178067 [Microdochium bolleyi]